MKQEEMIIGNMYLYKPYNWVFIFEGFCENFILCYNFYYDIYKNKTIIMNYVVGIIYTNDLKYVEQINKDYMHLFDINSLPSNNLYKINYLRRQRIKSLLA